MKLKTVWFPLLFLSLLAVSCIKEEAPNAEADIVSASISDSTLLDDNPTIGNNYVHFKLKRYTDTPHFAPVFSLTSGAIIEPPSGTERDFSSPREYTVTSENGQWQKTYEVSFIVNTEANLLHSFEQVDTVITDNPYGIYERFYEYLPNGQKYHNWATGNPGYNILANSQVPEGEELSPLDYPTAQINEGYVGKGVRLQTKDTGPLGETVGSPLAAGNLFLGEFVLTFPAIKSPHFGQPYKFNSAPVALKGYFKYKAGADFVVNNEPSNLTKDRWDAYAILFEKQATDNYLPGDHHFEDPRMVSVAHIDPADCIETNQWTEFYIPFHTVNGKHFDPDKAYMYTIVFTSSTEGAYFNGAVGSTLWLDEVELVTEDSAH